MNRLRYISNWLGVVALTMLLLCACTRNGVRPRIVAPSIAAIAKKLPADGLRLRLLKSMGLIHWDKVEEIRFTFNVASKGTRITRQWVWKPQTDHVAYSGGHYAGLPAAVQYFRHPLTVGDYKDTELSKINRMFVNDSYWFLMPLHLAWDDDVVTTDKGETALPIASATFKGQHTQTPATGHLYTVTYSKKSGGYTPGDSYDVYLGTDNRILQWSYHKGAAKKPNLTTTWSDYQSLGSITLSLSRHNADGSFVLWFSDVAIKYEGDKKWYKASAPPPPASSPAMRKVSKCSKPAAKP